MIASDSFSGRYQDLLDGSDEHLDDAHLMRWAGRFSRRVHATASGSPHLARKNPPVWVNHFVFHFQDPDWGHVTFKIHQGRQLFHGNHPARRTGPSGRDLALVER